MREKLLFVFVGLMIGLFVGFVFAGSIAQKQQSPAVAAAPSVPSTQGMPPAVSAELEDARNHADNFEAQVKAAQLYYQIQRLDDAAGYLVRANQIKPDDFETIANLGIVNLEAGHLEESKKWFERALAKQPDNTTVLDGYCSLLLQSGKTKAAADAITRLEKLDPANPDLPEFRKQLTR